MIDIYRILMCNPKGKALQRTNVQIPEDQEFGKSRFNSIFEFPLQCMSHEYMMAVEINN